MYAEWEIVNTRLNRDQSYYLYTELHAISVHISIRIIPALVTISTRNTILRKN